MKAAGAALAAALLLASTASAREPGELLRAGRQSYVRNCSGCHGEKGDGAGPGAVLLITKPRDFTRGVYKLRTTPSGNIPTDDDLYRTITRGVNRTGMPGFALLSEMERIGLVEVLKGFSDRFAKEEPGTPIAIPDPPASVGSYSSIARGREVYQRLRCSACHGETGRGDGPSAPTLGPDGWGNPQKPFNFTKGYLKSGPDLRDIYRTFMTGLDGTAMPSYQLTFAYPDGETIREGDAWHLVSYILSLRESGALEARR